MCRQTTFAERLGWPADARVVIFQVDDIGMTPDSNAGALEALDFGIVTAGSVMIPCRYSDDFCRRGYPNIGLHITLTSEWGSYKWGPISEGVSSSSLTDGQGMFWATVEDVVAHASSAGIRTEIQAQIRRAYALGFNPTYIDSHMFSLLAKSDFLQAYLDISLEHHIPALIPGGHCRDFQHLGFSNAPGVLEFQAVAQKMWDANLPVVDDIYFDSYNWILKGNSTDIVALGEERTQRYADVLRSLEPGITVILTHCAAFQNTFSEFSDSGGVRASDLYALTNEDLRRVILDQGIILSSWQELCDRRNNLVEGPTRGLGR
jgi:predicted glycoside hydrolase/deacetylase ChbG (UPF0249 family)